MRSVSDAITNAIENSDSYRFTARLTVYKSRAYFDSYTDHAPSFAAIEGDISSDPIGECVGYNTALGKMVSVFVNPTTHKINMMVEGSSTVVVVTSASSSLAVSSTCRPGIWENKFYYFDGSVWKVATYDPSLLQVGTAACITALTTYSSLTNGAIYPVSSNQAVLFIFDGGGIRTYFKASDATEIEADGRFIFPTSVIDPGTSDAYLTHYAGAAKTDNGIFAYITFNDGSVRGIAYLFSTDEKKGTWTDIFTSIPQDLSNFQVGNVFSVDNRIFICGNFNRVAQFSSETVYTLICWSDDGYTFSMDRRILFSAVALRFQAVIGGTDLCFSAANRTYKETAPFQFIGEDTDNTVMELLTLNGNPSSQWLAKTVAAGEQYFDIPYIDTGAYAILDIGVWTGPGYEYVKYHDVVVAAISKNIKDGARGMSLTIVPDGLWHSANMTHPYYMEIQGREVVVDLATDFSNLYAAGSRAIAWPLSVDFWKKDNQGNLLSPGIQQHKGSNEIREYSSDLLTLFDRYPVFGEDEDNLLYIYGWSRSGIVLTKKGQVDPTPNSTLNDLVYPIIVIMDSNGHQSEIGATATLNSTYARFPQTWFNTNAGSYPIIYNIPNPGAGTKIVKVGVKVVSGTGNTTFYIERVEMPGISTYASLSEAGFTSTPDGSMKDWTVGDEIDTGTIDITDPAGTLIDSLTIGNYYAVETAGGPWHDTVHGDNRRFIVNNGASDTGSTEPPWYANFPQVSAPADYPTTENTPYVWSLGDLTTFNGNVYKFISATPASITINNGNDPGENDSLWRLTNDLDYPQPYGVKLEPIDNFDLGVNLRNYRLYFRADTNHIYIKAQDTNVADNTIPGDPWTWKISSANPPQKTEVPVHPVNSTPSLHMEKKGTDTILFSVTPYTAWNFEVISRWKLNGNYSTVGCLGLGQDEDNYIVGYIKPSSVSGDRKVGLMKVRDGVQTTLYETSCSAAIVVESIPIDVRFSHRDGLFTIEVKNYNVATWPLRGTQFSYEWDGETDGILAAGADILHVGVYASIRPPRFLTSGFKSNQVSLPVMPNDKNMDTGTSDFDNRFPGSGTVDVDGHKYIYAGLENQGGSISGPFPLLKGLTKWAAHANPSDTQAYPAKSAIDIGNFSWLNDKPTHHLDLRGKSIATSEGYCFLDWDTEWRIWNLVSGAKIYPRNGVRIYSIAFQGMVSGKKIWITKSLAYVKSVLGGAILFHPERTPVYLDGNDYVAVLSFKASSGNPDQSVSDLLQKICQVSGTSAKFSGDIEVDTISLANGAEYEL